MSMMEILGRETYNKTSSTKENYAGRLTHQMAEKEINKNGSELMTEKDYMSQRTNITMFTHKEATKIGQHETKTTNTQDSYDLIKNYKRNWKQA